MKLNINSPAYFSKEFGVDDEIYWFFRKISQFFVDKTYSQTIETVGLMPVVAPQSIIDKGLWKESVQYDKMSKLAIISKQIDYDKYLQSNIEERKMLMVENILESIKSIKVKGKFDYTRFENDLLSFVGYTMEEVT